MESPASFLECAATLFSCAMTLFGCAVTSLLLCSGFVGCAVACTFAVTLVGHCIYT